MVFDDTIAAISSATGRAARMIVRVGGKRTREISAKLGIEEFSGGRAARCTITFDGVTCPAWVYQFAELRSYSGEDILELHIPGSPVLARMLLDWLLKNGARPAEAGEFTARAYFNRKLDLAQAEGVAAMITARGAEHSAAARKLMAGELARRLSPGMELLADTLAMVEAGIDFSDEGIEFLSAGEIQSRIDSVHGELDGLLASSVRLEKLTHEPTIVLAGRANAGKSTLTNALAGVNRSIVSPVAGTTRDVLSVEIALRRGMAQVIDVAGMEMDEAGDEISRQMREQARRAIEEADVVVLVKEMGDEREEVELDREADLRVLSKIDVAAANPLPDPPPDYRGRGIKWVSVSAKSGAGMEDLRRELDQMAFGVDSAGASMALTSRHVRAIEEALVSLDRAPQAGGLELVAAELRAALDALGGILGAVTPDDVLGRIFATFCIGK